MIKQELGQKNLRTLQLGLELVKIHSKTIHLTLPLWTRGLYNLFNNMELTLTTIGIVTSLFCEGNSTHYHYRNSSFLITKPCKFSSLFQISPDVTLVIRWWYLCIVKISRHETYASSLDTFYYPVYPIPNNLWYLGVWDRPSIY